MLSKPLLVSLHVLLLPLTLFLILSFYLFKQLIILLSKLDKSITSPIPSGGCLYLTDKLSSPTATITAGIEVNSILTKDQVASLFQTVYDLRTASGQRNYKEMGYFPFIFCGFGFWKKKRNFKMTDLIHEISGESIASIGDELLKKPFKQGEPVWDCHLFYTEENTFIFIRVHHLMADGPSIVKFLYALCGIHKLPSNFQRPSRSLKKFEELETSYLSIISSFFSLLTSGFIDYVNEMLINGDLTPINFDPDGNYKPRGEWISTFGSKLDIKDLKRVSKTYNCGIIHLLLAGVNKGLSKYFRKYHSDWNTQKVNFFCPLPVPGHPELSFVNHYAFGKFQSRLDVSDLGEKVGEFDKEWKKMVRSPLLLISAVLFKYLFGITPIQVIEATSKSKGTSTVLLSNVVGPPAKAEIIGGWEVKDVLFWMPIVKNSMALSAGILSYNGKLRINLTADLGCIPNRTRLDDLSKMIYEELEEICKK